ncbi:MAG: hypothetical protein ACK4SA_08390 [Caldilinea sp.]
MSTTSPKTPVQSARLFTIRLWQAAPEAAFAPEWRGKVQSLPDGEAYYFRDWSGLIQRLETMLTTLDECTKEGNNGIT